jgi:cytochrome c-type biogenesis protein CcmH
VLAGETDQQVRDFIVARYGNFVLLRPPLQADTIVLWFTPPLFLAAALWLAWRYLRGRRASEEAPPLSADEQRALQRLMEKS